MNGHTIYGSMPRGAGDVPAKPCIWSGASTDMYFIPAARPELGAQPMHMICTGDLILTYEAFLAGRTLSPRRTANMARLVAQPMPALIRPSPPTGR